ncbi:hypothetical protein Back11_41510 [Paenibacillus baekrokdamisoli]|uniref:Uncharacterized protein n=1 Tax=Paenibacillus baekrokdamisoli TaxID=1712516 RepID=A0A3G9IWB6_9BACL|nr:hypothetical protein [Paenibacillus baekrokdamisoli]MBB3068149.1 hypothetical protein [Paenibacillus baekrokdamisoli]BBH22806.1 hypothetical protein Back11_41510 [Paenibacillus baekrokdamisoli]
MVWVNIPKSPPVGVSVGAAIGTSGTKSAPTKPSTSTTSTPPLINTQRLAELVREKQAREAAEAAAKAAEAAAKAAEAAAKAAEAAAKAAAAQKQNASSPSKGGAATGSGSTVGTGTASGGTTSSGGTSSQSQPTYNKPSQAELNSQLYSAKNQWWDAKVRNDQSAMDAASKLGDALRSQGAQETDATRSLDADYTAKFKNLKQNQLNSDLLASKQNWWESRLKDDQVGMNAASKRGEALRAQGAQDTDASSKLDAEYSAKLLAKQNTDKQAEIARQNKESQAAAEKKKQEAEVIQNKLNQDLVTTKKNWWLARLNDQTDQMAIYEKQGEELRLHKAVETDASRAIDTEYGKLLQQKLFDESQLFQEKKNWWNAYANMSTTAMDAAVAAANKLRGNKYVNNQTAAIANLEKQNQLFLKNKTDYYNARISLNSEAMIAAQNGMKQAIQDGSSLSGESYKVDEVSKAIITKLAEWGSNLLDNSPEAASRVLAEADVIKKNAGAFQGLVANVNRTALSSIVNQIKSKDIEYWKEVSLSTAASPGNQQQVAVDREKLYNQLRSAQISMDFKNTLVNTVNTQIMDAKQSYWNSVDAGASSTEILAKKQVYKSLQEENKSVAGIIGETAVDKLNTTFLDARNQLNGYLKTGQYDDAIQAIDYLQSLRSQGATLNIRRNSDVTQAKADDFLYTLKKREWDLMENLQAPDGRLANMKIVAKSNLGANADADKITKLDNWNKAILQAKVQFWQGALEANQAKMTMATTNLNNAIGKGGTLSTKLDSQLDELNSESVRLRIGEWVYKGNKDYEVMLNDRRSLLTSDIRTAERAGLSAYNLYPNASDGVNGLSDQLSQLYQMKQSNWDVTASTHGQYSPYASSITEKTSQINNILNKMNQATGGELGDYVLPRFTIDVKNQEVFDLREQMLTAIKQVDAGKALDLYWSAVDKIDQGATLDIRKLEPNFFKTDWKKLRQDKMFKDTIEQYNREVSKEDITSMQESLKKMNFYNGEVTGTYNKEFLIAVGQYQYIIKNNTTYEAIGGLKINVDGKITDDLLKAARIDINMGRKVEWAASAEEANSGFMKGAAIAVGVADGVVSQLVDDGIDLFQSTNIYYLITNTVPQLYDLAKGIANKSITLKDITQAIGSGLAEQFVTPFQHIADNYMKVLAGKTSYSESQQFGRDLTKAFEAVAVVATFAEEGAVLMAKLGEKARKLIEEVSAGGPRLAHALEVNRAFETGVRPIESGSSKGTGDPKSVGNIVKDGNKTKYTNPAGNELTWVDQHPKNINRDIDNSLNSTDPGKATEAKVASIVRENKEVTGFGQKIQRADNSPAGDLDVVTKDEIIEVKKSLKAVTDVEQFDKYVNANHTDYFNPDQKKVILYIDKPLTNLHPNDVKKIEAIKSKGVIIVNSLDELKEVLK